MSSIKSIVQEAERFGYFNKSDLPLVIEVLKRTVAAEEAKKGDTQTVEALVAETAYLKTVVQEQSKKLDDIKKLIG